MTLAKTIQTRSGEICFPAYIPVTTFGNKYPLDDMIRPYLPRLAPAIMVSYHYAKQMQEKPHLPILVDSGGFASLFQNACVKVQNGLGIIELETEEGIEKIHPNEVLDFQEKTADVAFTLDFPIPPNMEKRAAKRRQKLTIQNALWALANRRRRDLPLYGCIQAWDADSAKENAKTYVNAGFDGIAIGGLVPRARDKNLIREIVEAVRNEIPDLPLHVFGLGNPTMVTELYRLGVDSVDSSSYVQLAANGRLWGTSKERMATPSPTERLHIALCNLAMASQTSLPLSTQNMVFRALGGR